MPSAILPPAQTANTTSPRDILLGYQLRRENRALHDAIEEQRAVAIAQAEEQRAAATAQAEAQRLREEELERKIQLVQQQNKQLEELMKDKVQLVQQQNRQIEEQMKAMGQRLTEHDEDISKEVEYIVSETVRNTGREIEKSVLEQLSARLPSRMYTAAMANSQDDDGQQLPRSSPPVLQREQRRVSSSPAAPQSVPADFVPPHQRYPLRRGGNAAAPAAVGPSSAPNTSTTAKGKENVTPRANLSRKRSIPAPTTPATPATPATAPATRARSDSSSSTLSSAPSSDADGDHVEPQIPDLPFNKRGTPTQGGLDVDIYFASAIKFARERRVHQESEEEQTTFILQIFKGMKKEERTEVVAALEEVGLAEMDRKKRTVQFLGLWTEIAEACDKEVLMEAKAKANLMRATAMMVA